MEDDLNPTARKGRIGAKRRKATAKPSATTSLITRHFSPHAGEKGNSSPLGAKGVTETDSTPCDKRSEAKDTDCVFCGMALCIAHAQEHSHSQGRSAIRKESDPQASKTIRKVTFTAAPNERGGLTETTPTIVDYINLEDGEITMTDESPDDPPPIETINK